MIAFRVSAYDTPCPPSPSRRPSRWARAGGMVANYWSLHPHGPWAELYRSQGLHGQDDVVRQVATRLWVGWFDHVTPTRIDELTDEYGLTFDDLVDDDWSACQQAAEGLLADGHHALLVPSAALPGTDNLVLFGQRLAIPFSEAPVEQVDLPCAVAADLSAGVPAVLPSVRHRSDPVDEPYEQQRPTPLP